MNQQAIQVVIDRERTLQQVRRNPRRTERDLTPFVQGVDGTVEHVTLVTYSRDG